MKILISKLLIVPSIYVNIAKIVKIIFAPENKQLLQCVNN